MRKTAPLLSLALIIALTTGCMGIRNISIDTRETGQILWAPHITSVAIVSNVVQQPDDLGHTHQAIGQTYWDRAEASSDNLAFIFTEALSQFLEEEGHFKHVHFVGEPLRTDDNYFQESTLPIETVARIMRQTGADAIISLDRLLMQTEWRGQFITEGFIYAGMLARIQATVRVYTPTEDGRIPVVQYADSIRWEGFDPSGRWTLSETILPSREEAMKELTVRAAERVTNALSPHWSTQARWYYTSHNSRMREGAQFAQGNQWDRALERWEVAYNHARGVEKAKAASNVALAHEMLDDLSTALEWATTANQLFEAYTSPGSLERRRSVLYLSELQRRLDNAGKLLDMN